MSNDKPLDIKELTALASMTFASKQTLNTHLSSDGSGKALLDILSVGTSAGGARAKAVVAFNPQSNHVRSGKIKWPVNWISLKTWLITLLKH